MSLQTGWIKNAQSLSKNEFILYDLLETPTGCYCENHNGSSPVLSVTMGEAKKIRRPRRRESSVLTHEFDYVGH